MESFSSSPGENTLTIAIAAGWVALGAMFLRFLLGGIKAIFNRTNEKDEN